MSDANPKSPAGPDPSERALAENSAFLRRLAHSLLGEAHAAEDVAQEAFAIALNRPGEFISNRSWLTGVVRRLVRGRRRSRAVRARAEEAAAELRAEREDPAQRVRIQQRVTEAVLALDEPYRTAVVLRYFHGNRSEDIARRLGATPAAVRQRLARARRILAARLEREFDGEPGGYAGALLVLSWKAPVGGAALGGLASVLTVLPVIVGGLVATALLTLGLGGWHAWHAGAARLETDAEGVAAARSPGTPPAGESASKVGSENRTVSPRAADVGSRGADRRSVAAATEPRAVEVLADESGASLAGAVVCRLGSGLDEPPVLSEPFRVPTGSGALAAWAPGRLPARVSYSDSEGDIQIRLRRAAVLSGRVSLQGESVGGLAPLRIVPGGAAEPADWIEELGRSSQVTLAGIRPRFLIFASDGTFRIEGLDPDWSGEIVAANSFQLLRCRPALVLKPDRVLLRRPLEGLVLELVRTPTLRGSVRWADTREPVLDGLVEIAVLFEDGTKSYRSRHALEAGRFAAGVYPYADPYGRPSIESVALELFPEGGERIGLFYAGDELAERLDPSGGRGPRGADLGVLDVHRTADVHFLVRDAGGRPIRAALAAGSLRRDYGTVPLHVWTDEAGRGVLTRLDRDAGYFTVGAVGYHVRDVPVAASAAERGSPEEPLVVTLEKTNRLEIELVGPPFVVEQLQIVLQHSGSLLQAEPGSGTDPVRSETRRRFLELLGTGSRRRDAKAHRHFFTGASEPWRLFGLTPDQELVADVLAPHGELVQRVAFRAPGPREEDRLVIPVEVSLRTLTGGVRGADPLASSASTALEGASVWIEWERLGRQWLATTGKDGRFERHHIELPDRARFLWIEADGFATRRVVLPDGLRSDDLGVWTLQPEHVVEVQLIEPGGREHVPERVWARVSDGAGGFEVRGRRVDARHRLSGLPPELVTVFAQLGGRIYSRDCTASVGPLVFEVPAHGDLLLKIAGAPPIYDPDFEESWTIRSRDDSSIDIEVRGDQPARLALLPGLYEVERLGRRTVVQVRAGESITWNPER